MDQIEQLNTRSSSPLPSTLLPHRGVVAGYSISHAAADRVYQIAALTAGFFLLATLL